MFTPRSRWPRCWTRRPGRSTHKESAADQEKQYSSGWPRWPRHCEPRTRQGRRAMDWSGEHASEVSMSLSARPGTSSRTPPTTSRLTSVTLSAWPVCSALASSEWCASLSQTRSICAIWSAVVRTCASTSRGSATASRPLLDIAECGAQVGRPTWPCDEAVGCPRGDQVAPSAGIVTHIIKVRVPDVDAAFARARDFGARVLQEPTTHEYGERSCMFEDVGGHRWELSQTVRDVEPEEWGGIRVAPW